MYKNNAPIEIEIVEIKVPSHFPNNIPYNRSIGDPKPKSIIQIIVNAKKRARFSIKLLPINSSILAWINL